ncbi:MAG: NACHT domain-containing protein [Nostocaceae cyanobacterium]|nr:NACHT domain-containing protein [Nostocaceae cyanobacterium]
MPRYSYGDDLKQRVWNLLEALITQVNAELKGSTAVPGVSLTPIYWQLGSDRKPQLKVKAQLVELAKLSKSKLSIDEVRDALSHYLSKHLGILEDKRKNKRGRGSENWDFILTFWHTEITENQTQFNLAWERQKSGNTQTVETSPAQTDADDWHQICQNQLEKQKRLTTNQLLSQREDSKHQVDDIHVPLALVERTKPEKRNSETKPEEGSRLYEPSYEEKQRFEHEDCLSQVLKQGTGKTQGKRIAVIGEPGAGKTTLLQTIAGWILNKNLGFPIWISLADLQGKTLEEYLLQRWLKNALELMEVTQEDKQRFLELFQSGKVWLLLDGVDELGMQNRSPLDWVSSQLEGWVNNARVVLSCRLNVWEANLNALEDFETYRLLNFSYPEQVQQFIQRWFHRQGNSSEQLASEQLPGEQLPGEQLASEQLPGEQLSSEQLWNELDKPERQRLQDLVKNPLRLALLCATWQGGDKRLPDTKAGLYHLYVKRFYSWKENCFPTTEQKQEELNAALGRLAKRAINQETSRFRLQHQLVRQELGDEKFELALQLGWLNKVGLAAESQTEEEVYAFYHPTFEEYFAALRVDNWGYFLTHVPENPSNGIYRIFEPQWKEVILLWLGREDVKKEEFIKVLVEFEDGCGGFYGYRAYFLAVAGIAEFKDCSLADEIVKQIVKWGFGYLNINKQEWQKFPEVIAAEANAVIPSINRREAISNYLIELIQNCQDEYIRLDAAYTLGKIDKYNSLSITSLLELIQTFQDENFRWLSAYYLIEIGKDNPFAINALIELSKTSLDENIRHLTTSVLGDSVQDSSFIQTIFEEIKNVLDGSIRSNLVDGLGEIDKDNPLYITNLIEIIQNSENESDIRLKAIDKLGVIGEYNSIAITNLTEIIQLYQDESDEFIQDRAAFNLVKIGKKNPITITTLIELIQSSKDENTRLIAASILEEIDKYNSLAITTLVELIQTSQREDIYGIAAAILGDILLSVQMERVVTALRGCVSDETYKNDYQRFDDCYSVMWQCAQNMSYPEFYQAWHNEEDAGKLSLQSQTLRSHDYPDPNLLQTLQTAISNDTQLNQTIHLICIDTSQFLAPDNPAAEIYLEMVQQGCPERPQGEPTTMQQLKVYWKLFRTVKRVVLLFYTGDTTVSHPHGERFLVALSKFGGTICVIGEKPRKDIGLQFFSPSQPMEDVLQWLREV